MIQKDHQPPLFVSSEMPPEGVFGKLRVKPTGNDQQMFVKWADDYLFGKRVESLKSFVTGLAMPDGEEWVV